MLLSKNGIGKQDDEDEEEGEKIKVRVSKGDYQKLRGEDSRDSRHSAMCLNQPTQLSHPISIATATEFSSLRRHQVAFCVVVHIVG